MDAAVALVQAYLYANGYFTVTEYPVYESMKDGDVRTATDLDILAVRFPGAGRLMVHRGGGGAKDVLIGESDPALQAPPDCIDLIVGEVKEGRAELNLGARNPAVLRSALTRFGAFAADRADDLVECLVKTGTARAESGPQVRLIAFGSHVDESRTRRYEVITLGHITRFLHHLVSEHWDFLRRSQLKDPGLGFFLVLQKAIRLDPTLARELNLE